MEIHEFYIPSSSGIANLHCMEWIPSGEVKAIVQIAHGMMEHVAPEPPQRRKDSSATKRFQFKTRARRPAYRPQTLGHFRVFSFSRQRVLTREGASARSHVR